MGDKIYIVDDKGDTLVFKVREIKLFDRNADATDVFTSNDGLAHLNLITCEGIWNQVNGNYPERRVVFTDAIPTEGAAPKVKPVSLFSRSLSVGAKGTDVAELQTFLEKKGFLVMPHGVAKGYFGTLTRNALAKYQSSVGLSASGIFNMLTRARVVSVSMTVKPTFPLTSIASQSTSPVQTFSYSQIIPQLIKSLFAIPRDLVITSAFLIAIAFVVFKIIRL